MPLLRRQHAASRSQPATLSRGVYAQIASDEYFWHQFTQ